MGTGINKDKAIIIRNTINDIASKDFDFVGKMPSTSSFPLAGNKAIVDRGWNHVYAVNDGRTNHLLRSVSASVSFSIARAAVSGWNQYCEYGRGTLCWMPEGQGQLPECADRDAVNPDAHAERAPTLPWKPFWIRHPSGLRQK